MYAAGQSQPTVGSLFAGIGGFDIRFECAGFRTAWQVENNTIARAVLEDRFRHAKQFEDVCAIGAAQLDRIDVVVGGFPCQDVSSMGKRRDLAGNRTELFFEAVRILNELRPEWVVLENVTGSSLAVGAAAFKQSSKPLPSAGMWDAGGGLMLNISESPQNTGAFSWSDVWDSDPPLGCWLTPRQWELFLARRARTKGTEAWTDGLTLPNLPASLGLKSPSLAQACSLPKEAGIRWMSGGERLKIMGFASDWMRPTLQRLMLPETPLPRRSSNGRPAHLKRGRPAKAAISIGA